MCGWALGLWAYVFWLSGRLLETRRLFETRRLIEVLRYTYFLTYLLCHYDNSFFQLRWTAPKFLRWFKFNISLICLLFCFCRSFLSADRTGASELAENDDWKGCVSGRCSKVSYLALCFSRRSAGNAHTGGRAGGRQKSAETERVRKGIWHGFCWNETFCRYANASASVVQPRSAKPTCCPRPNQTTRHA